jgi:hypothetical protein
MTPLDLNAIYNLLPAVYRIRDANLALQSGNTLDPADADQLKSLLQNLNNLNLSEQQTLALLQDKQQRGPLKSLIAILAEQIEVLQESLYQSYDDLFIETCQEWVVPYIGDLVGSKGLSDFPGTPYSLRAAVADTIGNRRRKGTAYGLEQLAHDVTGWPANIVEYFQLLCTTQFMNHIRPQNLSFAGVRRADWGLPETPFDTKARTADVRSISAGLGKFNIPNIGIYLWRLLAEPMKNSPAFQVDAYRYKFDALGRDTPLFTAPPGEPVTGRRVTPLDVPMPISRHMLYAQHGSYYGQNLSVWIDPDGVSKPKHVRTCNLSDVTDASGNVIGWAHAPHHSIAIDPELGRIVFPSAGAPPTDVHVNYSYGFSAQMGGGPYSRPLDDTADVLLNVPTPYPTIQAAIDQANVEFSGGASSVIIEIGNSEYYRETPSIKLPEGASLAIQAADSMRPVLLLSGHFKIRGDQNSSMELNGLMIAGGEVTAPAHDGANKNLLTTLTISHCTLAPLPVPIGSPPAHLEIVKPTLYSDAQDLSIEIDNSITGPLRISPENTVTITASIVDAGGSAEVAYGYPEAADDFGAPLTITASTVIGKVATRQMTLASDTIFLANLTEHDGWVAPVNVERLQQGCVRFSYVPPGSQVPRAFRCYPGPNDTSPTAPAFTSLRFGDPGYCQLTPQSGAAILQGADNQSEMGAFNGLYQPQRVANLNTMLEDYLRFGLQAGIFFAT